MWVVVGKGQYGQQIACYQPRLPRAAWMGMGHSVIRLRVRFGEYLFSSQRRPNVTSASFVAWLSGVVFRQVDNGRTDNVLRESRRKVLTLHGPVPRSATRSSQGQGEGAQTSRWRMQPQRSATITNVEHLVRNQEGAWERGSVGAWERGSVVVMRNWTRMRLFWVARRGCPVFWSLISRNGSRCAVHDSSS